MENDLTNVCLCRLACLLTYIIYKKNFEYKTLDIPTCEGIMILHKTYPNWILENLLFETLHAISYKLRK